MRVVLFALAIFVALCCSQAQAYPAAPTMPYTITFDDIPPGSDLSYYDDQYGLWLVPGWEVAEYSGTNAAVWRGNPDFGAGFGFGHDPTDYPETTFLPYTVRSVRACFSTEPGVLLTMTGYRRGAIPVALASVQIGSPGEPWNRRFVEISSGSGDIAFVAISGITSQGDRYRFSMDSLTISPVPEPSSLLALGMGGFGMLGAALRRRVRARA